MGLALLLNERALALVPRRAWLKAAEHARLLEAEALIAAAHDEAARVLREAAEQVEALKASALEQALDQGRQQAAEQLAAIALQSARVLQQLESVIARAVTMALQEVVQELPPLPLYEMALRKAGKVLRGASFLTLRVPPRYEEAARAALSTLLNEGGLAGAVDLVVDAALPDLACVMESDAGLVSAGLDVHVAAIGRAVAGEVARLASPAAGEAKP